MTSLISTLNRRLGEYLGYRGAEPRFKWCWSPDMPWFTYSTDDRTLIKRCWADAPAPDGNPLGPVWLLAEFRASNVFDDHGFGIPCDSCRGRGCQACGGKGSVKGIRLPRIKDADFAPYFETALAPGKTPTEALTANYCWALDRQMSVSAEQIGADRSLDGWLTEEKYAGERREQAQRAENLERSRKVYDDNCGAFGNLEPGKRDGFMSFQNIES